jgi:hypothetical protein
MPILNFGLGQDGPVVDLLAGVSEPRERALVAAGQPIPNRIQFLLVYDGPADRASLAI